MKLNARLVEAFAGTFLSPMYDEAVATPPFHRECWDLYTSDAKQVAIAAPRGHAKSTALTDDYILAAVLFRIESYIILVSSTEDLAIEQMTGIIAQLKDNDDLQEEFGVRRFISDAKTDIIVEMTDGHQFRVIAKGAGQRIRGRRWKGKRPGLIVCDDLEDDETVENKESRMKFRRWFFRALKPLLRKGGKVRIHGTILHEDALLSRLMRDDEWQSRLYKAHESFDDFSNILWPEQWPEDRLRAERATLVSQGDAAGYSQEYLNDPLDNDEKYLRKDDLLPMTVADHESPKVIGVGVDFAISKADRANRTSFTVGGKDADNILHVIDQRAGRWNSPEIIERFFEIDTAHRGVAFFCVEGGQIWLAISPILYNEMRLRNQFFPIHARQPIKDKASRGRSLQSRTRAHAMRFDKDAEWYPGYEDEILRFTGTSEATLDDQFDSSALLSLGFEDAAQVEEEDFDGEEEIETRRQDPRKVGGRSLTTGY